MSWCCITILGVKPLTYFFIVFIFIIYPVGSPLFFQFSVMCAGAGARFWQAGHMTWLRVGPALMCSTYLSLGSAFLAPMFLGIQPPCVTIHINIVFKVI